MISFLRKDGQHCSVIVVQDITIVIAGSTTLMRNQTAKSQMKCCCDVDFQTVPSPSLACWLAVQVADNAVNWRGPT